jgi:toxin FitB
MRSRGDGPQARKLEGWLDTLVGEFADHVLPFDADTAQVWGRLRVPNPENPRDKQIAATALIHDLVLVTRNVRHFAATGATLLDPFAA